MLRVGKREVSLVRGYGRDVLPLLVLTVLPLWVAGYAEIDGNPLFDVADRIMTKPYRYDRGGRDASDLARAFRWLRLNDASVVLLGGLCLVLVTTRVGVRMDRVTRELVVEHVTMLSSSRRLCSLDSLARIMVVKETIRTIGRRRGDVTGYTERATLRLVLKDYRQIDLVTMPEFDDVAAFADEVGREAGVESDRGLAATDCVGGVF